MRLLLDLQERRGLAVLFITHAIALARRVSDRMVVMICGRIVEEGPADRVLSSPAHPHTRELIAVAMGSGRGRGARSETGCAYHPECYLARGVCREQEPPLVDLGAGGAACHALLWGGAGEHGPDGRFRRVRCEWDGQ